MREVLEIVVPLVLPTALYLFWLLVRQPARGKAPRWSTVPWLWLAGAGAALLALLLLLITIGFGNDTPGTYVPPRLRDGQIVPGHIVPEAKP